MEEHSKELRKESGFGIAAFVLGIVAFLSAIFVFPSIILAIISIILGIVALAKKSKKVMPVVGIVLSSIAAIISILVVIGIVIFAGFVDKVNNDDELKTKVEEGMIQFFNGVTEGITDELDVEDKIEGNSFKASDGSLIKFNNDGTYIWYQNSENTDDNYYKGRYTSYLGDSAIEKIQEEFSFDEEAYKYNTKILRTDIYYLKLEKEETVINGEKKTTPQTTNYALFFYNGSSDECEGMNLNTQNLVHFEKVD